MGHALRSALDANVESVMVQIDFKNAFNSVSGPRSSAQHHPAGPTAIAPTSGWRAPPLTTPPILSRKGVRQGGPLGPLLFGIVLQSVLERTNAAYGDSHVMALHDDVCLVGSAPAVRLADGELTPAAASKAPRKCGVLGYTPSAALETAQLLGIHHREEGVQVAGCPISTPAYVTRVS
jgi:hypothetical protein